MYFSTIFRRRSETEVSMACHRLSRSTLIMASGSKRLSAIGTSLAVDVMALTRAAKDLPVQYFDAF